ncbi:class I SAM-dependent methyltransferase [Pseudooceanicola sp.]|uniref:class I SAM-dependent methyltransferase n=1 Tax=Pseudooceanicola sp. TaxID=1914328 RepID=UPI0035C6C7A5
MPTLHDMPMSFADRYQSVLVPVIFEPWAEALIAQAPPRVGDRLLDLACGTGAVARQLARGNYRPARLAALDHSEAMLSVARHASADTTPGIEWVKADAGQLPFEDDSFDRIYCQQALQYFPDRVAALKEVRRVLAPGGTVLVCVQREIEANPMLNAQAKALDTLGGPEAGDAVRETCSMHDAGELYGCFRAAGFREIEIEPFTLFLRHPDARVFAAQAIGTEGIMSGLQIDRIDRAVDVFVETLDECFDGAGMAFPHASHIVLARV